MFTSNFHKQATLSRIISGQFRFKIDGISYTLIPNTIHEKAEADEIALQIYEESDTQSEEQLVRLAVKEDLWDAEKEKNLEELGKIIKSKKRDVYRALSSGQKDAAKRLKIDIRAAEKAQSILWGKKYAYSYLSRERIADNARQKFLLLKGLRINGTPVFIDCWNAPDTISDKINNIVTEMRITEEQFRELARTDPWRTMWNCGSPFGFSTEMTEEQRILVNWTKFYDNIYEHPECPPETIISDDDAMDGWIAIQKEKRDRELSIRETERRNPKIKDAQEVFLTTKSIVRDEDGQIIGHSFEPESIGSINDLNDDEAKAIKKIRTEYIKKEGSVNELDMPDTRKEIILEINRNMANRNGSNSKRR